MNSLKNKIVGFLVSGIMLFVVFVPASCQSIGKKINETRNMMNKDSNRAVLESVSASAKKVSANFNASTSMVNMFERALIVELENEIELETWMLEPFILLSNKVYYLEKAKEDEILLEPWMSDLSLWK